MLAHKYGSVRIMDQIAGKMWKLGEDRGGHVGMALCRNKNAKTRRCEQRSDELPRRACVPWPTHDPRVGGDAQELIQDRPSRVPGIGPQPLPFKPESTGPMKLRVNIGRVHQNVGVDDEHYRPSMA